MENTQTPLWQTVSAGLIAALLVVGMATLVAPAMNKMAPAVEKTLAERDAREGATQMAREQADGALRLSGL